MFFGLIQVKPDKTYKTHLVYFHLKPGHAKFQVVSKEWEDPINALNSPTANSAIMEGQRGTHQTSRQFDMKSKYHSKHPSVSFTQYLAQIC